MTTFDNRERGFENKFALEQEKPYVPKLASTRYTAPKVTPRPNQNAKTRRMLRRNGPADVTRMSLR